MCLQMQSTLNNIINKDEPIIFNKLIINVNPDITYNYNTGYFTINSNGTYYVKWWANINTCDDEYASFSIKSCKGDDIEGCTTKKEQLCGDAMLSVCDSHLSFALINNCNSSIGLCPYTNVKANISIFKLSKSYIKSNKLFY